MKTSSNIHRLHACLFAALLAGCWCANLAAQSLRSPDPDGPVVFTARGDRLHMTGTMDSFILQRLRFALNANPGIKTIVMDIVPGSTDDDAALAAYREVRRRGLNTLVPASGLIASGGVDFFCAGVQRIAEPGSKLLVHPWTDDNFGRGDLVPFNSPLHLPYRQFYAEMGIDPGFYDHTLFAPRGTVYVQGNAIPDMHEMSLLDLQRYRVITGTSLQSDAASLPQGPSLEQLSGTWTWTYNGGRGTIKVNAGGSFEFAAPNYSASGTIIVSGNLVSMFLNGQSYQMSIVNLFRDQVDFTSGTWTRQSSGFPILPPPTPFTLDGNWMEVRTDGRPNKAISISNGFFSEQSSNGSTVGSVTLSGDRLTLNAMDGVPETFRVRRIGNGRLNFIDGETGQLIQRFHWIRR